MMLRMENHHVLGKYVQEEPFGEYESGVVSSCFGTSSVQQGRPWPWQACMNPERGATKQRSTHARFAACVRQNTEGVTWSCLIGLARFHG
eukprot:5835997-Amphidinium_carterae.1